MREYSLAILERVAAALEVRLDLIPRWHGGDLDRMLNANHAALHETVARLLNSRGWLVAPEATFSVYGERGAIDVLAFHPPLRVLLVVELKTQLVDMEGLLAAVDRYRRLAPGIARERGWAPLTLATWVAIRDTPTNRRHLAAHASTLRAAFPDDGRAVRGWLARPEGTLAALSFLSDSRPTTVSRRSSGVRRVRRA